MDEQKQLILSDVCDCECHEYGHLKYCECCFVCPDCGNKIKHYEYAEHLSQRCPTKKLIAHRLAEN